MLVSPISIKNNEFRNNIKLNNINKTTVKYTKNINFQKKYPINNQNNLNSIKTKLLVLFNSILGFWGICQNKQEDSTVAKGKEQLHKSFSLFLDNDYNNIYAEQALALDTEKYNDSSVFIADLINRLNHNQEIRPEISKLLDGIPNELKIYLKNKAIKEQKKDYNVMLHSNIKMQQIVANFDTNDNLTKIIQFFGNRENVLVETYKQNNNNNPELTNIEISNNAFFLDISKYKNNWTYNKYDNHNKIIHTIDFKQDGTIISNKKFHLNDIDIYDNILNPFST